MRQSTMKKQALISPMYRRYTFCLLHLSFQYPQLKINFINTPNQIAEVLGWVGESNIIINFISGQYKIMLFFSKWN